MMAPLTSAKLFILSLILYSSWEQYNPNHHYVRAISTSSSRYGNSGTTTGTTNPYDSSDESTIGSIAGGMHTKTQLPNHFQHRSYNKNDPPFKSTFPNEPYEGTHNGSTSKRNDYNAPYETKRKKDKSVKDKCKTMCKKFFNDCRRGMKHRSLLLLILGMVALCVLVLYCANTNIAASDLTDIKDLDVWKYVCPTLKNNPTHSMVGYAVLTAIGLFMLGALLGFYYFRARRKYIQQSKYKRHKL
ncbi:Uncharacterized protein PCOAH_00012810 [Plasmodium coatneyi]|uniref:Uncharacterized protein n=1 Tax=Plasmodium coatneyi TaxID=208452 RepID=A0A1B1DW38_9APIC|nr:Uncharacterized protein PCOAH_00012810 [Plasmodium coatneyi]ANQ06964.1 Uncharacterized protein PCOAH_00012810 [Plasmodium coatneyi]